MDTASDYKTMILPAYGIGEAITLAAFPDWVDRVQALAPYLPYGPNYSRPVKCNLRDMTVFVTRGDRDAAELYLSAAEAAAFRITSR